MNQLTFYIFFWVLFCFHFFLLSNAYGENQDHLKSKTRPVLMLNLEECLKIAIQNNHQRLVSRARIEIAEAQHQQALSSYWPQVKLRSSAIRMEEGRNFIFPEETTHYTINLGSQPLSTEVTVKLTPNVKTEKSTF